MDPRFVQWQNYRPSVQKPGRPWNEGNNNQNTTQLIRPVGQNAKPQQTERRSCCGGRRAAE